MIKFIKSYYDEAKEKLHINDFEAGLIAGIFITGLVTRQYHKRMQSDISKALSSTVINIRNVQ